MGSAIAFKAAKAEDSLDSVNFPDQDGPTAASCLCGDKHDHR